METTEQLTSELERLRAAIRKHRDYRGDSRCWMDDEELYKVLPEGYTPPERDTLVELDNCRRFIQNRHRIDVLYQSPQRRIEELEEALRVAGVDDPAVANPRTGKPPVVEAWVKCPSCGREHPPAGNFTSALKCSSCRRRDLDDVAAVHPRPTVLVAVGLASGLLALFLLLKLVGVIQ